MSSSLQNRIFVLSSVDYSISQPGDGSWDLQGHTSCGIVNACVFYELVLSILPVFLPATFVVVVNFIACRFFISLGRDYVSKLVTAIALEKSASRHVQVE